MIGKTVGIVGGAGEPHAEYMTKGRESVLKDSCDRIKIFNVHLQLVNSSAPPKETESAIAGSVLT